MKKGIWSAGAAFLIILAGCMGAPDREAGIRAQTLTREENMIQRESESRTAGAGGTQPVSVREETAETGTAVEILALVKEISEESLLLTSQSDAFPGAFWVEVPETVFDLSKLTGGDHIQIRMSDQEKKDGQGLPCYTAWKIAADIVPSGGKEDIMLTAAPEIVLRDRDSDTKEGFSLHSGNYSWSYREGEEMQSIIACGAAAMETAQTMEEKLSVTVGPGTAVYALDCAVLPDRMNIQEWKKAVGQTEPERISEITCYGPVLFLSVDPDRIYVIRAEWEEGEAGFYGEAEYVLVTE